MLTVCLTGNIGSGKSLVAHFMEEKGAHVISLDELSKELLNRGTHVYAELSCMFPEILDRAGNVDKKKMASLIFNDDEARRRVEKIIHPAVWRACDDVIASYKTDPHAIVVVELALLYGSSREQWADVNVGVVADESIRLQRLILKRNMSKDDALARMRTQPSNKEIEGICHYVITNNFSSPDALKGEVNKLIEKLRHNMKL
ncbi:MAG: dephospho-CoA kinase [Actinomycetaceae bacterium]|nr:dephospho-CoA kinase [Actinomycetaceae bacterium]